MTSNYYISTKPSPKLPARTVAFGLLDGASLTIDSCVISIVHHGGQGHISTFVPEVQSFYVEVGTHPMEAR